ncbi:MAG: hypothetical protein QOE86_3929 [Solirubrobacteraceae bacterium]|jgi:hypothetical protein|nr:hypothetical protein [Solirubrobacteraceae bacterium]
MNSTVKRLAAVVAVGAMGILVPATGASAAGARVATASRAVTGPLLSVAGFPALTPGSISFVAPSVLGGPATIGPTVFTVGAGNVFVNTTITTTQGGAVVTAP